MEHVLLLIGFTLAILFGLWIYISDKRNQFEIPPVKVTDDFGRSIYIPYDIFSRLSEYEIQQMIINKYVDTYKGEIK